MQNKQSFIAIAGNIGCGKSSLTTVLSQRFQWKAFYEPVETNPYLRDFYQDMKAWSFHTQMYFLTKRFQHICEILKSDESIIQDRSIYEDAEVFAKALFAKELMGERDYMTYLDHFQTLLGYIRAPQLLIYLQCSPEILLKRVRGRDRSYETNIDLDYLNKLQGFYDSWIEAYDHGPKAIIDVSRLDFVNRAEDLDKIMALIRWEMEKIGDFGQAKLPWAEKPLSQNPVPSLMA